MATDNEGEKHFRDENGNVFIKGSLRPDGTLRKDRRINEKYFQKLPRLYVIPKRRGGDENNNGFMTDSQISGTKKLNGEKLLVEWIPDDDDKLGASLTLEENNTNGWRPEEMFDVNEKNHGVKSSFKSSLEGYTIQISTDKNSEEYRKMEAQAVKTAEEIVASKRTNNNKPCVKLENGEQDDCICNRQKCFVICRICGSYETSKRIRKICSIHPSMYLEFLDEEIAQCRYRHCQAPSEYLEEITKEFMNKFVKEKFEQKHVHWAPETFEIHASKRANKPAIKLENGDEEKCICNRQKCFVICRICGSYMSSTRIRKICSIHPSIELAEDISQCRFRPCQALSEDLKEITKEFINEKLLKHAHPAAETFQNIIKEVKCDGIDEVNSIKKEIKVENVTPPPSKVVQNRVNLGNSNAKTQIGKPNPVIPRVPLNPLFDRREGIDEVVSIKKEIKFENDTPLSNVVQNQINLGNSIAKTQIGKLNPVIPGVPWYGTRCMSAPPKYYYDREKLLSLAENTSNSRNFPKFQEVKQIFPEILLEEKRTKVVPILEVNKKRVGKINNTRREYWIRWYIMIDEETTDSNRGSHNAKKIPYTREFLLAVNEKKPVCKELPSDWDRIKRENSELTFFRNVRETGDLQMANGVMDGLRPEMPCKTYDPVSGEWISGESVAPKPAICKRVRRPQSENTEVMDPSRPQMPCKRFDPVSGQWI